MDADVLSAYDGSFRRDEPGEGSSPGQRSSAGQDVEAGQGSGHGRIAITFDDGPHPDSTIPVLDRLDKLGIRATFFCLGSMVAKYPELVTEIISRGHDVGMHGYEHVDHLLRTPRWIWRDMRRCVAELDKGIQLRWFRPPKGVITGTTLIAAKYSGLDIVLWSAWGKEWTTTDPEQVAQRVIRRLDAGVIVLLHDADTTSPPGTWKVAYEALPRIADAATARHLYPVTLSELL